MNQPILDKFQIDLVMRYTRISCMPFQASYRASGTVQAQNQQDAVRQACLCLDRDLEQILARVNAINVAEFLVEVSNVEPVREVGADIWNPTWFPSETPVPPYFIVR